MVFAYIVADIIHIINMLFFCEIFFRYEKRKVASNKLVWGTIVLISALVSLTIYLWNNDIVETAIYLITVFVLFCCLYEEKISSVIIVALWIIVIMSMLDTMSVVLIELLCKIIGPINECATRVLRAVIIFVYAFVLGKLYNKNYKRGIRTVGLGNLVAFTILTIVDAFIVLVIARVTIDEEQRFFKVVYFIAFVLVIVGFFLQLGAVILLLMQRNIYKESQQLTEKYLEEQKNHYEYLEKRETETKKFRHDLRSHMEMLSVLAKEHRYDEFDKYVEEINVNIDSFGNNVSVQNGIVDAIINKYYSEAVASDVSMEVKGRFPSDCKIDAYHLCTIFSNILSNALEATIEAKKKWISVECRYTDNNILVEVKNTFDNKNGVRNGKARTHKKDANNHGFGLENVKDSISKYNGLWEIDIDEDIYTITISFNYVRQE